MTCAQKNKKKPKGQKVNKFKECNKNELNLK